ncbi:universal stress protein [Antrihabitans cavernicola]|uniref:Universal stress protein n=1 Tax=Antrihabitans cavernicola TaxID=2495913 RepID=A0A5A7S6Y6_9NOCA|nr:universal stress protein [Spelaeibacter cavernicola]KAA0021918.1 universal stress protein [Spelaeibacter cavernicola]
MTLVVGYAPDGKSTATIHLAALLAASTGEDLVVCSIIPSAPAPGLARIDGDFRDYMATAASAALDTARQEVPQGISATYVVHEAPSTSTGILELANRHAATIIVLGSSSAGVFGHVALGSVTSRLLYSSDVSVALSPRGFRVKPNQTIARVTAAYDGTLEQDELVLASAAVAARLKASLRLAAFAVRGPTPYTTQLGSDGENLVVATWVGDVERQTAAAIDRVRALPDVPDGLTSAIGHGRTWSEALEDIDWQPGDILAVGSSKSGPVARVFLGSRAIKIVRDSPVPVVVVPRSAAARLVDSAGG